MAFLTLLMVLGLLSSARCWDPFGRSLAATCTRNEFAVLEPTITHAPVLDLEWVGANDLTVFAITKQYGSDAGGLWRSKDGGATFQELTEKLNASINSAEKFRITGIYSQKSSPANLLVMGSGKYMWTSDNYGETLKPVNTTGGSDNGWLGRGIRSAKVHPWHDNWLLLLVQRPSCKPLDKAQIECPYDLMLSKDMFSSDYNYINLTANSNGGIAGFVDFDWGASLCPKGNCTDIGQQPIPDELIMATMYARSGDYDQPWDKDVNFVTSTDFFKKFSARVKCGNMFEVVGRSVYLAVANSCPSAPDGRPVSRGSYPNGITLYTSMDAGDTFTRACLPVALDQEGYELVETHDGRGAVVIVEFEVDTGYSSLPAASVYTAGPHHALFSLSLTNVYNQKLGTTADFARVEGVPGIYIANQMLPWGYDDGGGSSEPMPGDINYDMPYEYDDLTQVPLVETRITFNAGGRWQRIPAPKSYTNPTCDRCKNSLSCFLHLNGLSAWDNMVFNLPAVYSNPSAPGLVIATGNVAPLGFGLDPDQGVCTWLSRDGGVTWTDVGEGAYIYEFADWGGVVVMARHPGREGSGSKAVATELRFSMDYGRCWQSVSVAVPLLVDNIRIEPDGQRAVVIVHGRACKSSTLPDCSKAKITEGLMYALNVEKLMREEGTENCDTEHGDFETWAVAPMMNGSLRCVLGQQLQLQRRKQDKVCFQGGNYNRPAPVATPCNCTKELDTECEYGFIRSNNECQPISQTRMPTCPVIESGTYTVSESGRRMVHGDQCPGPALFPDTDGAGKANSRGGHREKSHSSGWVVMLVLFLLMGAAMGAGAAWYRFKASDEQRETVRELAASALAGLVALWGLLVDKISALIHSRRGQTHGGGEEMGYFQPLGDPGYDVEGRGNVFTLR